jgi:hypothetical protein
MLKTAYFVDVSASMSPAQLDFALDLALSVPGPAFVLDSFGVHHLDAALRTELEERGRAGTAMDLPSDPRWDRLRRVLLTDGDAPEELSTRFDVVMVIKDVRDEVVREVMTD